MWLMNLLFGKGSDKEEVKQTNMVLSKNTIDDNIVDKPKLIEEMDENLKTRIASIVMKVREKLIPENKTGHNTIMKTDIYTMEFSGINNEHCKIVFNDREKDDNFTAQWDVDNDSQSADDIYMFHLHESGWFTVEEWHPDENNTLHFEAVPHEKTEKVVAFIEWSMNIGINAQSLESFNIAA